MPTLTEEIKKLDKFLNNYAKNNLGGDEVFITNGYHFNSELKAFMGRLLTAHDKKQHSLIQSTVKGCVPEKIKVPKDAKPYGLEGMAMLKAEGVNQTIDTITANLKEKGLI